MADTVYRPGSIELQACLLFNYNRSVVDIRHLIVEFNVYTDIFANGVKIDLVVADATGLIEMFPIIGDETLVLSFKTPTFENVQTYVSRVSKITDRKRDNERSEIYVLHCASPELFNNARTSINKRIGDTDAGTIVRSIFNQYLAPSQQQYMITRKTTPLSIQATEGTHNFVFPRMRPIDAIRFVCQEAQSKIPTTVTMFEGNDVIETIVEQTTRPNNSQASNFVFFERHDGWHFRTIDSLIDQQPVDDFYLAEASVEEHRNAGEKIHSYQRISSISMPKQFDILDNTVKGLFKHHVNVIDPLTKTYVSDTFNYDKQFDSIGHIGEHKIYSPQSLHQQDSDPASRIVLISNVGQYNTLPYINDRRFDDPQLRNPRRLHNFIKYDAATKAQLSNAVVDITIPGNTDIVAGSMINVHIPQSTEIDELMRSNNLLFDKTFFATAVRHTYNKQMNNFFTVIGCVKDSYAIEPIQQYAQEEDL